MIIINYTRYILRHNCGTSTLQGWETNNNVYLNTCIPAISLNTNNRAIIIREIDSNK